MISKTKISILCIAVMFQFSNLFAQINDWKIENNKDKSISIKTNIIKGDDKTNVRQSIEYIACTTAQLSINNCYSLVKEAMKSNNFFEDNEFLKKKSPKDYKWLSFYYLIGPWPKTKGSCMPRITFLEDSIQKTLKFTLTTNINSLDKKGVKYTGDYNLTYELKDLGKGNVGITTIAKISPIVKVPEWLLLSYFPDGPAKILKNFIKAVHSKA